MSGVLRVFVPCKWGVRVDVFELRMTTKPFERVWKYIWSRQPSSASKPLTEVGSALEKP